MKYTAEQMRRLRVIIERESEALTDEEALTATELFPRWQIKHYETGARVRYNGILYKCLQEHDAQETWTPDAAPSLWVRVDDPHEEFPEWRQPTGSTDAYRLGDKVSHLEKHWVSTVDYNTWEPSVYGWDEVA